MHGNGAPDETRQPTFRRAVLPHSRFRPISIDLRTLDGLSGGHAPELGFVQRCRHENAALRVGGAC